MTIRERLIRFRAYARGMRVSQRRLRADGAVIGTGVGIAELCIIDKSHRHLISIGDNAKLTSRVIVLAHDASTKPFLGYTRVGRVNIGAGVWIGMGSIILPGVTIGPGALIGAGSVVTGDIPGGTVAVGNPCRPIGTVEDLMERRRRELLDAPTWEAAGWTAAQGITPARMEAMRDALDGRFGYLE